MRSSKCLFLYGIDTGRPNILNDEEHENGGPLETLELALAGFSNFISEQSRKSKGGKLQDMQPEHGLTKAPRTPEGPIP